MSCNVLIVDDSMSMRAVIRKILMLSKFDVDSFFEAANGREALKVLGSSWVDVVITDINMPVMNGIEAVKKLRPLLPDTRIIMVTSHGEKEVVMEILQIGVNEYVKKPFDRDTVIAKIKSVLKTPLK